MTESHCSAGLNFMRAAEAGISKSIGDRARSATMGELLHIAICMKMQFNLDDMPRLSALGIVTSVGVFRPGDEQFYRQACLSGGTFAKMWEKANSVKPFKACIAGTSSEDLQRDIRVASNIAVLLAGDDDDELMPRHQGMQVWWVTSIDLQAGTINLGRYRLTPTHRYPFSKQGVPAKRKKLNRQQWDEAMQGVKSSQAESGVQAA